MKKIITIYFLFLLTLFNYIFIGCAPKMGSQIPPRAKELVERINSSYYRVAALGFRKIVFECESDVINYAVSQIRDDLLRNQLKDTKFKVEWDNTGNFTVKIMDIPTLGDQQSTVKLVGVYTRAKDRMLAAFLMNAFVFNGINAGDVSKIRDISEAGGFTIFTLRGASGREEEKFYFDNNLVLRKAELLQGDRKITEIQYEFDVENDLNILKKIHIIYPGANSKMDMHIEYKEFDGTKLPAKFNGASTINGQKIDDIITVLNVTTV